MVCPCMNSWQRVPGELLSRWIPWWRECPPPGLQLATWAFSSPLSLLTLSTACFSPPAQSTWAKSLCRIIFHALRARGHQCWLPGCRVPWWPCSQPLISPLRGGERAKAPPALRRCSFSYCCDSPLLLGCICAGSDLLTAGPQEPSLCLVVMGLLLGFHMNSEQPPRPCSFPPSLLTMLWQQKPWWGIFLLILENVATQIATATPIDCEFPMWWSLAAYFHLTFAAAEQSRCYYHLHFYRWGSCPSPHSY